MIVVVMPMRTDLFDRHHAAVSHFAFPMLELDCSVENAEILAQPAVDLFQNARALRWWNIRDGHVARQGVRLRAQAPDMQVVNVLDPFDVFERRADLT